MITEILSSAATNFTVVLILMLIDLVTGMVKALQHHSVKSAKLRNSLNKCVIYFTVLLIGGCLNCVGEEAVSSIFVIFLCLVEGISVLENLQAIFPNLTVVSRLSKYLKKESENKINE